MKNYLPPSLNLIEDFKLRAVIKPMDDWLRQASAQLSVNSQADASSTAGNIASIKANGGARITGDTTFTNTPSITITNTGQDFKWTLASILAFLGSPVGLTANSTTAAGASANAPRADHTHAIASAAQTGFYGTSATVGIGDSFLRADGRLVYPEALGTAADRTQIVTLTRPGAGVAVLTPSGMDTSGGVDYISILAPNDTSTKGLTVNQEGLTGFGSTIATLNSVWTINKLDFNNSTTCVTGIQANLVQQGSGDTSLGSYVSMDITGQASSSAGANANPARIGCLGLHAGAATNANYSGATTGLILAIRVSRSAAGSTGDLIGLDCFGSFQGASWTSNSLRMNNTNTIGYLCRAPLNSLGTTTNITGFQCNAFSQGTNRIGYDCLGFVTGTPTISYGYRSLLHSVGTTRRSFYGDNSFYCSANDYLCDTAAKGLIVKDGAGSPHYWRYTVAADGTPAVVDTGTTLPTV